MRLAHITGVTEPVIGASTEIELSLESGGKGACIEILRVMARHTSAHSGSFKYTVSIGNQSGFLDSTINNIYKSAEVNHNQFLDDAVSNSTSKSGFAHISSDGKIYVRFSPTVGSDNVFEYSIYYKI